MFEWFWDILRSVKNSIKSWVEDRLKPIWDAISGFFAKAKQFASNLVNELKKAWEGYVNFVRWLMSVITREVKEFLRDPIGYIKRVAEGIARTVKDWASNLIKGVSDWFKQRFGWLWGQVQQISGSIWKQIGDMLEYIKSLPAKVWQWVYPKLTGWFNTMLENFINFVLQAIRDLQLFLYDHMIEYMRYTFYEQMSQVFRQNGLPVPDREVYLKTLEKNKIMAKRMLGGG